MATSSLSDYPAKFRKCRVRGHQIRVYWRVITRDKDGKPVLKQCTELCIRCTRKRSFDVQADGYRTERHDRTRYDKRYLTPKTGWKKRDFAAIEYNEDFRLAMLEGRVQVDAGADVTELHSTG